MSIYENRRPLSLSLFAHAHVDVYGRRCFFLQPFGLQEDQQETVINDSKYSVTTVNDGKYSTLTS